MPLALEAIRRDRGYTQAEFAKALGVNTLKYQSWESLTKEDLNKIATLLKVKPEDIRIPR